MSNRKTRKKKLARQRSNKDSKFKELKSLKIEAIRLEIQIAEQKKKNLKQFNIRNLRVFQNTCHFLAPFVISSGITASGFSLFGGGLPFHSDEIVKYKTYSLDYQTDGDVTMDEEYKTNRWFDDELPSNRLIVHTPWEYKDNQYVRIKREYDINKLSTLDLYNAILDENYDYIMENVEDYNEEVQVVNSIEDTINNGYSIDASLHMLDKEDVLKYNETDSKNNVITIIELVLGLGIGGLVAYFRKFSYLDELCYINRDYHSKIKDIKLMEKELSCVNQKILSLSKKGGRINEK